MASDGATSTVDGYHYRDSLVVDNRLSRGRHSLNPSSPHHRITYSCSQPPPQQQQRRLHHPSHITSLYQEVQQQQSQSMTLNGGGGTSMMRGDSRQNEGHLAHHVDSDGLPSETAADNMMNLRNRALRASTADGPASPALTSSSASADVRSSIRNRSTRRRSQVSARSQFSASQQSSPTPRRTSICNFFPLKTIGAVCELFRSQVCPDSSSHFTLQPEDGRTTVKAEPNLALLSIVLGIIEAHVTSGKKVDLDQHNTTTLLMKESTSSSQTLYDHGTQTNDSDHNLSGSYSPAEGAPAPVVGSGNANTSALNVRIPTVLYEEVERLLDKFSQLTNQLKESLSLDLSLNPSKTTRDVIKKISDTIWSRLNRTHYKDRPHMQTLYSYLTHSRLDSFGLAYTIVATCQLLGLDDVQLVMSEDHSWVQFGDGETCEITWHSKNEDRVGQPIPPDADSWLYLNGHNMLCDRFVTVATLVSALNPSFNTSPQTESEELALLQKELLWILYDYGHLDRYPMALGNLGDLEDCCPTTEMPRMKPIVLFQKSIDAAKLYYDDSHVYPYTYLGGYHFRKGRVKEALKYWAEAAQVMRKYNHSRDDEEIYKEFQEIANELIPWIIKFVQNKVDLSTGLVPSFLQDPEVFATLLRLYDGLCAWEEGSSTPVLHIGWTKPMVQSISKFPYTTRSQVSIKVEYSDDSEVDSDHDENESEDGNRHLGSIGERTRRRAASYSSNESPKTPGENGHFCQSRAVKKIKLEKEIESRQFMLSDVALHDEDNFDSESYSKSWNLGIRRGKRNIESSGYAEERGDEDGKTVQVMLISKKFAGLKNLLTADKLNTSAIQLQLTAQSQVNVNKRGN